MSKELVGEDDYTKVNELFDKGNGAPLHVGEFSDSQSSLASKEAERRRLQAEVEAFLARGGKIEEVAPNVVADPPRKPESNYGGQPI